MLTCHLRLTRPSGQRESFHPGEDWEEDLKLASPGRLARIVGLLGEFKREQSSSGPCVLSSVGVLSLYKLLRSVQLMDGKVSVPNSIIFYFNWAMEGAC